MPAANPMSAMHPRPHHPHQRLHPQVGKKPTKHEELVKNAQKLVSQTFFGTMLKQMHNSPFKSKIFSGGRGGEAFGSLLDQRLSDRMAGGAAHGLVNSMVDRWEHAKNAALTPDAANHEALKAGLKQGNATPAPNWRPHVPTDHRA